MCKVVRIYTAGSKELKNEVPNKVVAQEFYGRNSHKHISFLFIFNRVFTHHLTTIQTCKVWFISEVGVVEQTAEFKDSSVFNVPSFLD